ncbi:MAG: helix-hairpin-helix domain-containing protein, partial [Tissierellia bacterium]|nr:helix-hairpin-helix domain-containing protein [Tissierellia bacterium]
LENLMNATEEELTEINDVGHVIAHNLFKYFENSDNAEMIRELMSLGLNTTYLGQLDIVNENPSITNKTFVITGSLSRSRNEVREQLESFGAKVTNSVTSKTDVVIVGDEPGSKYDKALKLNIEIWNEEKLNEITK